MHGHAVYALLDPRTDEIRYIGYSRRPRHRLCAHRFRSRHGGKTHRDNWIRVLKREGYQPDMRILCVVSDEQEAKRVEVALIASHRRRGTRLTNHTAGGEGAASPDDVTRKRMSRANKRKWRDPVYREKTAAGIRRAYEENPSLRAQASERTKRQVFLPVTDKTKAKLRAAWVERRKTWVSPLIGTKRDPEICKRISESKKGVPRSEGTKAKVSATRIAKFAIGAYDDTYIRNRKNGRFVKSKKRRN